MNIIVIGCGRVGAELAYRLYQNGHKAIVLDRSAEAFHNLPLDFRGRTVEGDALSQNALRRCGIEEADGLAAVTSNDSVNVAVGHLAHEFYKVPVVVARNFNSRYRPLYDVFGLQVVSASSWGAQRIEEMLYQQSPRTVFSAGNGEVELYEFTVPDAWDGRPLSDIIPERECAPVAFTRAGRAMMPELKMPMKKGDILLVSATLEGIQGLRRCLDNGVTG
ncbi:MAG: NAD-binding protein [Anaerolineales bacterium]|nr:NAD-binding protein [Anaerolineales bacterium]